LDPFFWEVFFTLGSAADKFHQQVGRLIVAVGPGRGRDGISLEISNRRVASRMEAAAMAADARAAWPKP
jgi:hypothetical protein